MSARRPSKAAASSVSAAPRASVRSNPKLVALAVVSALAAVALLFVLSRPAPTPPADRGVMAPQREQGDPHAARDEPIHFAPGSPGAVAERFLRARLRYRYDLAAELATGTERARCEHNVALFREMLPEQREAVRQGQLLAEAAVFDLERAVVDDLPPGEGAVARKRVRGVVHAVGPVDGRTVESRRGQTLELHLVEGAWRVAVWTPDVGDPSIRTHAP